MILMGELGSWLGLDFKKLAALSPCLSKAPSSQAWGTSKAKVYSEI